MLQRLSASSPYVCDLKRGPIEPANRMASASSTKMTNLLEPKRSSAKLRTPLKLLGPEEVPIDTTMASNDIRTSLQPVWYSEQTIVDDHQTHPESNRSITHENSPKTRTTLKRSMLPPIESEISPINEDEEILPTQPSLMHKSSTFTVESSMNLEAQLDELEKENLNKEDTLTAVAPPSDESFRALEQLLGLGSNTAVRESPKTNHDTLSLTVVTPTDIINATATSMRMSYAPKDAAGSLPSSQEISTMPTIESTTTNPPSFLIDNTTLEDEAVLATINQQNSLEFTETGTNTDDELSFSFELNDFPNNSKAESVVDVPEPVQPTIVMRAPTCADVAYRALLKPRSAGRISQPVKAQSPLAKTSKPRSSAPPARFLRSSCRRISNDTAPNAGVEEQPTTNNECFVNDESKINMSMESELVEIVTVPEEDESMQRKSISTPKSLNLSKRSTAMNQSLSNQSEVVSTPMASLTPMLSREYTFHTPTRRSSRRTQSAANTPANISFQPAESPAIPSKSMLNVLLTQPTKAAETRSPVTSKTNSPSIPSRSMLNVLLTQPTEAEQNVLSPVASKSNSPSIPSKSMLNVLLTQPTVPERISTGKRKTRSSVQPQAESPAIPSRSMLNVLLTQPTDVEQKSTPKRQARSSVQSKTNSPANSMLNILLTKPTDTEQNASSKSINTSMSTPSITNSPTIPSRSMLEVLLTKPTENMLQDPLVSTTRPSLQQISSRKSKRLSTNATPRVSINPLHSSTPSTTRRRSMQMVSIGEQEQVLTTVPQTIDNDSTREIEIVQINDTNESIQRDSSVGIRFIDASVQTTPTLNASMRRHMNVVEQPATPIMNFDNSSSSITVQDQSEEMMCTETQVVINLHRNVRFQLTPTTDARLAEKEKFEETLRGLKPDIVIEPIAMKPEPKKEVPQLVQKTSRRKAKPKKKKALTLKKKKASGANKKAEETKKVASPKKPLKKTPEKRTAQKKTVVEVTPTTKRSTRKRANVEVTSEPVAKRAKQTEVNSSVSKTRTAVASSKAKSEEKPVVVEKVEPKRSVTRNNRTQSNKSEKSVPAKTKSASAERRRSASDNNKKVPEKVVEPKRATSKKTKSEPIDKQQPTTVTVNTKEPEQKTRNQKNKKSEPEPTKPVEKNEPKASKSKSKKSEVESLKNANVEPSNERELRTRNRSANGKTAEKKVVANDEPKAIEPTANNKKRRLESVEKPVETKKKEEVKSNDLTHEEQPKFEEMTVAALKSRLNSHKQDVPKTAKKADLVALLIKIETNLLKEQKPVESATAVRTTRRHKK